MNDQETSQEHNMALPTGNEPVSGFVTPAEVVKHESSDLLLQTLFRLVPPPVVPRLSEKVLMQIHLQEVNSLLFESSLMTEHGFAPGCEQRCRVAIKDSFANFPDIARQVGLWFNRGASWAQVQADLIKTFASARDVAMAYSSSLSALLFGPTFATECRDLFVIYHSVFEQHPHKLIDFVERVCSKLPSEQQKKVVSRLMSEAVDEYWQLARPFWDAGSSETIVSLIEERIRVDTGLKDFAVSQAKNKLSASHSHPNDRVRAVNESTTIHPASGGIPAGNWLMSWVDQFPSVWVVEPRRGTPDVAKVMEDLRKRAVDSKGPLKRKGSSYYLLAFKDDTTARGLIGATFSDKEFRPFTKNV